MDVVGLLRPQIRDVTSPYVYSWYTDRWWDYYIWYIGDRLGGMMQKKNKTKV